MISKTMAPTLQLDLDTVAIDVPLAQQVPYALSRYYLALPLGRDHASVSVGMAYPENAKARFVLGRLLEAQIVPVFIPAERLLPVLEQIYCPKIQENRAILAWYEQPEWKTAVTTATSLLSKTLHLPAASYEAADLDLDEALTLAGTGQYELFVMPLPDASMLINVLDRATVPLFFVQSKQPTVQRILVVMRGFASDEYALDWLIPFARQGQAAITLMPLVDSSGTHWRPYHRQDSPAGQHLERCLQRLQVKGITINLKYHFGNSVEQVVDEMNSDAYNLLVLSAEAQGDYVSQVITAVEQQDAQHTRSIFVLKPLVCQPTNH